MGIYYNNTIYIIITVFNSEIIMTQQILVAFKNEIPEGKSKIVNVNGNSIAIFNIKGNFFAISNVCAHQGGPVGEGETEGLIVTCPWHGWQFALPSGMCVNFPGPKVDTYKVVIKEDKIFIEI